MRQGAKIPEKLRNYDFQITSSSPVSFVAKTNSRLWYLETPAHNSRGSEIKNWFNKAIAYACVHSFGRRMLYPGSLGILKTLLFQQVSSNRMRLIFEQVITYSNIEMCLFVERRALPVESI